MTDAAIVALGTRPGTRPRFPDLVAAAHISKSNAYQMFPDGTDSVLDQLHHDMLVTVIHGIKKGARGDPTPSFRHAVTEGIRGGLLAFGDAPFTVGALRHDPTLLASYLSSRDDTCIGSLVADFAARCACCYGSEVNDPTPMANRFVRRVIGECLVELPDDPARLWPDPAAALRDHIESFIADVGLVEVADLPKPMIHVPHVEAPERPARIRLLVV